MNIKFISKVIIPLCLLIFCISCTSMPEQDSPNNKANIKVLCTTGMIHDLVSFIGQEHIEASTLIKEDLDPHTYELVKGDDEKLLSSDMIFYNGLGLEHSPNLFRHLQEHPYSYALGNYIQKQHPEKILYVDGLLDPHIWMDISLWEIGIDLVVQALSDFDPPHQALYRERGQLLHQEMQATHQSVFDLLQEVPEEQRYLVTCHDAFNYFTKTYLSTEEESQSERWRERCKAPEGLSPDSQLSMNDLKEVIDHLEKHNIQVIFPESNVNLDSVKKIKEVSRKKGMRLYISPYVLYADSMGKKGEGQDTYLKMLYYNAEIIAKCLKAKEAYDRT